MPIYEYRCATHGPIAVRKPMERAGEQEYCTRCLIERASAAQKPVAVAALDLAPMRRIYSAPNLIVRPHYYNARPGDPHYDDFDRELELGELKDDATPVSREADRDYGAEDRLLAEQVRLPDDWLPESVERELHQIAASADFAGEWGDASLVSPAMRAAIERGDHAAEGEE